MKKQGGGRIINITISTAKQPGAESMPTSVSRAAGLAITKALSKEFAPDNILVNTVCIGLIKSGQHERRFKKSGQKAEDYYAQMVPRIPLGRVGEAERNAVTESVRAAPDEANRAYALIVVKFQVAQIWLNRFRAFEMQYQRQRAIDKAALDLVHRARDFGLPVCLTF